MHIKNKKLFSTLGLFLTAFIWGCAFVAQSVGADNVGPFTFLALRNWIACIALIPVIAYRNKTGATFKTEDQKKDKKMLLIGGILCGIFLCSASATQQAGIATTTTAKAGFLTALYVILVPILSIFFGRKIGLRLLGCIIIAVTGLYLLCINGPLTISSGDTLELICALLFACQIITIDKFAPYTDGVKLSWMQFFVTAIVSTVSMFLFEDVSWITIKNAGAAILYAGFLSSTVGYTLQIVCQKDINPSVASMIMSLESVFGAISGWILLGQSLSFKECIGCILMFVAIIIAQLPSKEDKLKQGQ